MENKQENNMENKIRFSELREKINKSMDMIAKNDAVLKDLIRKHKNRKKEEDTKNMNNHPESLYTIGNEPSQDTEPTGKFIEFGI